MVSKYHRGGNDFLYCKAEQNDEPILSRLLQLAENLFSWYQYLEVLTQQSLSFQLHYR